MNLVITITTAGTDTGPFNIYSDVDGYINAFDTNISKAALLAGFATANVPDGTTEIKVMSVNALCNNSVFSVIVFPTTTTTSTSSSSTTTTTSTSSSSTTTTTSSSSTTTTTTTTEAISPCTFGMDIAFLIDITGSMAPIIESIKASIGDIIDAIEAQVDISDYKLGIVLTDETLPDEDPSYISSIGYTSLPGSQKIMTAGSFTDKYTTALEMFDLNNESSFTTQLNKLNTFQFPMGYGVEGPEPTEIALQLILSGTFINPFRTGVSKYILVFTDNEPGGDDGAGTIAATMAAITSQCITDGVKVFVFGDGATYSIWQDIANNTGGDYSTSYSGSAIIDIINEGCSEE